MSLPAFFRSLSVNNIHCLLLRHFLLAFCAVWILSSPMPVFASSAGPYTVPAGGEQSGADGSGQADSNVETCDVETCTGVGGDLLEAGSTCRITGTQSFNDLITDLDFGDSCHVELEGILDVKDGSVTLHAKSFTIATTGQIKGVGTKSLNGGNVAIETIDDILINSAKSYGAIRLNGSSGGTLSLTSSAGSVKGSGKMVLNNIITSGFGGVVSIRAKNNVDLTGSILAVGGTEGNGGSIYVEAEGDVSMMGDIIIKGSRFAFFEVLAGGELELRGVNANGKGNGSGEAEINLHAEGPIDIRGVIEAQGFNGLECGNGGDLTVSSAGAVTFHDRIDLDARAGECTAGELDVTAKRVTFRKMVRVAGMDSPLGTGGSVNVTAEDDGSVPEVINAIVVDEGINTNGGTGGAGTIEIFSDREIRILGELTAMGVQPYSAGNTIELRSEGLLSLAGEIVTNGGWNGVAGDVSVSACRLTVNSGPSSNRAKIKAEGASDELDGLIKIVANDRLELIGVFRGDTVIRYGEDASVDISGAEFYPRHTEDPNWPIAPCTSAD